MKYHPGIIWVLFYLLSGAGCTTTHPMKPASKGSDKDSKESVSRELAALYAADQKDRMTETKQWHTVIENDRKRHARVMEIIQAGELDDADDFYHAAMILQHGEQPEDHLRAHVLATIAGFNGHRGAMWLSAAALDRFLQGIDRPQIFGTQYFSMEGGPWTQEPYDRSLHDSIREKCGVPTLVDQVQRLKSMNEGRDT